MPVSLDVVTFPDTGKIATRRLASNPQEELDSPPKRSCYHALNRLSEIRMSDPDARSLPWLRIIVQGVVIVGSILLAFAIDAAWDIRQDRVQEAAYLSGILVDLRSDSTDLVDRQDTAIQGMAAADRLLELRRDPGSTAPADSLAMWFLHSAFVDNFQVLDHTYREILGGGLSVIRDESLRRQIADYYRSIESAEFFTEYYKGEETDFWDLLAQRLDPDDFEGISREDGEAGHFIPNRLIERLRSDDEIANAILMNRHWAALRLDITGRRLTGNRELAEELRSHLAE